MSGAVFSIHMEEDLHTSMLVVRYSALKILGKFWNKSKFINVKIRRNRITTNRKSEFQFKRDLIFENNFFLSNECVLGIGKCWNIIFLMLFIYFWKGLSYILIQTVPLHSTKFPTSFKCMFVMKCISNKDIIHTLQAILSMREKIFYFILFGVSLLSKQ